MDCPLVFLISQPRAGSTLLQLILREHPRIQTTTEPWIALHPVFALKPAGVQACYNSLWAHSALRAYLESTGQSVDEYRAALRDFLLRLYAPLAAPGGLVLDKTPRYYWIVEELAQLFPSARFLFLLRNPADVLRSILKTWIGTDWAKLQNYRHDLLQAPVELLRGIERVGARGWAVRYEDLVADPDSTLPPLFAHLGLDYDSAFLHYGDHFPTDWRFGDPVGVRQSKALRRKKTGAPEPLSPLATSLIRQYLQTLGPETMAALGYDLDRSLAALGPASPSAPQLHDLLVAPQSMHQWLNRSIALFDASSDEAADHLRAWRDQFERQPLGDGRTLEQRFDAQVDHVQLARQAALSRASDGASSKDRVRERAWVRAWVISRLRELLATYGRSVRVALFGNGCHTEWLLELFAEELPALVLAMILDDRPAPPRGSIPVVRPESAAVDAFDVLLLSSDLHEPALERRARALWGDAIPIWSLYKLLPMKGPFEK